MISIKQEEKIQQIGQQFNDINRKASEIIRTIINLDSQYLTTSLIKSNQCYGIHYQIQYSLNTPKKIIMQDYNHYMEVFASLKRAQVRKLTLNERKSQQKEVGKLPYLTIVQSISERNIQKSGDSLCHSVLKYIEQYPFERIGLNLGFRSNSFQNKRYKNGQNERNNINQMTQYNLYSKAFPSYDSITSPLKETIQMKFTLYIQSKYKILKSSNQMQISQFIQKNNIYNYLFCHNSSFCQSDKLLSCDQHNITHKCVQDDINKNESNSLLKSQYNFNMSKYFMVFLLQLLVKEHLDQMKVTPEISEAILKITSEIQKISKRNEDSKTNFYNHNHFNLLFLKINPKNQLTIEQNQNLFEMHKAVFKIINFQDNYSKNTINIMKEHITCIILSQLNELEVFLSNFSMDVLDIKDDQKKDIEAKVDYFFRVKRAIMQLQRGKMVNRF